MPKLKTSSSFVKRFKVTSSGKILRHQAGKNHLLQKKSSNRKRKLSSISFVKKQNIKVVQAKILK